jgi:hypothetical protein
MRQVCNNPRHADYVKYGARGVTFDPAFEEFWDFVDIVESRLGYPAGFDYTWKLSRKDQTGNYTIKNLKWDQASQVGRRCAKAFKLKYKNKTLPLRDWCEITGINFHTLSGRIERGWTPAEILGYKPGPRAREIMKKRKQ